MLVLASIDAVAGLPYLVSCMVRRVRRLQRPYLLVLWIVGMLALLIAAALLSCDPDLAVLRETNYLLYGVMAALLVLGAYVVGPANFGSKSRGGSGGQYERAMN
jgi:hypothetical protein